MQVHQRHPTPGVGPENGLAQSAIIMAANIRTKAKVTHLSPRQGPGLLWNTLNCPSVVETNQTVPRSSVSAPRSGIAARSRVTLGNTCHCAQLVHQHTGFGAHHLRRTPDIGRHDRCPADHGLQQHVAQPSRLDASTNASAALAEPAQLSS